MKNLTRKNQQLLLQARKIFIDENEYDEYELIGYCRLVKAACKKLKERPDGDVRISSIQNVLKTLDKKRWDVLRWRYWDGYTRATIGAWLGVSGERIRQLESKGFDLVKFTLNESSGDTTSIEALNLECSSYRALKRAGINTIEQLVKLTPKQLLGINRIGKSSFGDIKQKLIMYIQDADIEKKKLNCGTPIDVLKLSIRLENALKKAGIVSAEQLFSMSEVSICRISGVGIKGLNQIIRNKPKELTEIDEQKIDTLRFSVRVENALKRAGILSVDQLLLLSIEEIYIISGIGTKGFDEIMSKRQELLCK